MVTRADIVEEAREWVGTPFVHQDRTKGKGVDCANFIAAVAEGAGATDDANFERNYRRKEDGVTMLRLLRDYMEMLPDPEDAKEGDVLALCDEQMRQPDVPRHLMILTAVEPHWRAVHASERGVREHRLDLSFKRRIHSAWRIRTIEEVP